MSENNNRLDSAETESDEKKPELPNLGLATNAELQREMEVRRSMGHTHPDYKTVGYDGPVA